MHQDKPRFSTNTSHKAAEFAAVALVNESPTAATISISPKNWFNFVKITDLFEITEFLITNRTWSQLVNTFWHRFTPITVCFAWKWITFWQPFLKEFSTLPLSRATQQTVSTKLHKIVWNYYVLIEQNSSQPLLVIHISYHAIKLPYLHRCIQMAGYNIIIVSMRSS